MIDNNSYSNDDDGAENYSSFNEQRYEKGDVVGL